MGARVLRPEQLCQGVDGALVIAASLALAHPDPLGNLLEEEPFLVAQSQVLVPSVLAPRRRLPRHWLQPVDRLEENPLERFAGAVGALVGQERGQRVAPEVRLVAEPSQALRYVAREHSVVDHAAILQIGPSGRAVTMK